MKYPEFENYFDSNYHFRYDENEFRECQKRFYAWYKQVEKYLRNGKKQKRILELGSASGVFYWYLPKWQKRNYVGLELDQKMVNFANKIHHTNRFLHCAWEDYVVREKFDLIFGFEVLEHLKNPIEAIKKMAGSLTDGGKFIGTTPYPYASAMGDETHFFVLHPKNWERLFLQNGFSKVIIKPWSFVPFLWRINRRLNTVLPFRVPIPMWGATTLMVASR